MATTDTKRSEAATPRKRQIRPEVSTVGKRVIAGNREALDLLEAYDRDDPEAVRLLRGRRP